MDSQKIKGNTALVGLFGNPVAHSISPEIHNHAFSKLGLDFAYVPLKVEPADIATAIEALRVFGFAGANVTIPHKQNVAPYCKHLSDLSHMTGTVNTLYYREGDLCGTTTDSEGFRRALKSIGRPPTGQNTVILGNGGTARTLAFDLAARATPKTLTLVGRNPDRVSPLAQEIRKATGFEVPWTTLDSPDLKEILSACTLLVNCTPVGMHPTPDATPLPEDLFNSNMTVFDTIYNPSETLFLRQARTSGCIVSNGLRMLLYQGPESFKYWTGVEAGDDLFDLDELQSLIRG